MIYYVSGDDTFNKNNYINQISEGKEQIFINMNVIDYSELMGMILSIDLFSDPKIYILEGFKGFTNKSEKYSKANTAILNQIFATKEELVLVCDKELNRATSWYQNFGEGIEVKSFPLEQLDFDTTLAKFIEEHKIEIDEEALELLKVNFPNNIYGASNDLVKIWEYTNHNPINKDDVITAGQILNEHKIFELYNLILLGKTPSVIKYLNLIRNEGITDSDILLVSFTQIKRIYETRILIAKGYNDFKIAEKLGTNVFATKQNRKLLNHVTDKRIEMLVQTLADFDYQFKSGRNTPENLVDLLSVI